jgi:hypothetical protein
MDGLCEFVFLENSVLSGLVMEKTEGDYRVRDIYSKSPTKGKFNNLFTKREEGNGTSFSSHLSSQHQSSMLQFPHTKLHRLTEISTRFGARWPHLQGITF